MEDTLDHLVDHLQSGQVTEIRKKPSFISSVYTHTTSQHTIVMNNKTLYLSCRECVPNTAIAYWY